MTPGSGGHQPPAGARGRGPLPTLNAGAGPGLLLVRTIGNWLNLSTPAGLAVAALGGARIRRGGRGVWLAEGYRYRFPTGGAFTIGTVITTARPSFADLDRRIPGVLEHEEAHTWQYTYACGLFYLPVYAALMGWSWLRTGDRASANFFERQAGLAAGGYVEAPRRDVRDGMRAACALMRARSGTLSRVAGRRCACADGTRGADGGA
ncbi:MAG: hypothetical protein M0Z51_13895 [Propionibacterium sp.]|nr:hypothetical protein [Propionibacterium sp.]